MFPTTRLLVLQIAPKWEAQNRQLHNATVYRTASTDIYHRHNEYCRRVTVPKERLLELRAGEGWERLCKFLGKPVPDEAYPKKFVKEENRKFFLIGAAVGYAIWTAGLVACGAVWYFGAPFLKDRLGGVRSEL
jgi:hypothetical protein